MKVLKYQAFNTEIKFCISVSFKILRAEDYVI